jgi:serine O-acetyltransferase
MTFVKPSSRASSQRTGTSYGAGCGRTPTTSLTPQPIRDHATGVAPLADVFTRLVYLQRRPLIGPVASVLLRARGTYIPRETVVGERLRLFHTGHGVVIDDRTRIHDDVGIFHNVTIGRGRPWLPRDDEDASVTLERHVILCSGAAIVMPARGHLVVREGTVVGANAVLTESTGRWEVWAGAPARRVSRREPAATIDM